jgi:Skp family chaperone for outer membrane proteins|tara:strand:- start:111 stop:617 length:507 start_codon:yes stop_codon:yes gene_type:complete
MRNFFLTILITFFLHNISYAKASMSYVDIDFIVNQSIAGKNLSKRIKKEVDNYNLKLDKIKKELKDKEVKILAQKKLINEEEFKKKINELRNELTKHKEQQNTFIQNINEKKITEFKELFEKINPILTKYATDNSIDVIINKTSVVLGKKELDITKNVLKIVDQEIKK